MNLIVAGIVNFVMILLANWLNNNAHLVKDPLWNLLIWAFILAAIGLVFAFPRPRNI